MLLSKIQIETVPSEAAYYKALIKGALDDATTQLTNCADPNYAGTSYDALQSLVNKYTGVVYHSPAAYMTAVDELEAGITVLKTRKSNVDTYISNLESAITYLSENV